MTDDYPLTLRQIDKARGDMYAIGDDLEFVKFQISRLPTRTYLCRALLAATASIWALLIALALLLR
jgi:hypothetical protein